MKNTQKIISTTKITALTDEDSKRARKLCKTESALRELVFSMTL
jgi:hypothetical protein